MIDKSKRNLPHWTKDNTVYWITFRLADSLPIEKLRSWKTKRTIWLTLNPKPWNEVQWDEYHREFGIRFERWLDAGMGSCVLRRDQCRGLVVKSLLHYHQEQYRLHAGVIMPNHVHILIEPIDLYTLPKILQGIKGASSRNINKSIGRSGKLWMEESYDHIVRSKEQYEYYCNYIRKNPIKAGLVEGEYWLWEM